jgi:C4-dicarboxylate-specific signal transduction histidine kinase
MTPHFLQHHLFRPFAGEWESGEGLGLSLVEAREALRRLGGDLEVASLEGEGTRVSMVCPIYTFEEAPEQARCRVG